MIKQPINIRLDYGEVVSGYLVEGLLAMYVSDRYLYLVRVREQNGKYQQDSGHLILGQVEDGWSLIPVIFAKLQNMSAWELITQYLNWNVIDSSLDIVY